MCIQTSCSFIIVLRRHGGHAEWLHQQETRTLAGQILTEARELQPAGRPPLTDQVSTWVLIRYLMVVRKLIGQTGAEKADFQLLRQFSRDLMAFQRGDHAKARLQFEWVRFKLLSGLQPVAPCPEPPKTEATEVGVTPDQPAPRTMDHASRITHHAPPSAPVRPSQTFEILDKSVAEPVFVVAQIAKSAVSPVAKPACRGHAQPHPNHPAAPFYSAGFCNPSAPPSAPVSPGQTFEFFQLRPQRRPAREPDACLRASQHRRGKHPGRQVEDRTAPLQPDCQAVIPPVSSGRHSI